MKPSPRFEVTDAPSRLALFSAFGALYFIWGSTYLAIRFAVETIPPFLMLGARFGLAGVLMFAWLRARGAEWPSGKQWRTAAVVGGLMLCVGTGSVAWAEQFIPSGWAALLATTVPLWMVLLDWLWKDGPRPNSRVVFGLLLGLAGVMLLFDPIELLSTYRLDWFAASMVLVGALGWSAGSLHGRNAGLPANPFVSTAMQMLMGGLVLIVVGLVRGEGADLQVEAISMRSLLAWSYLLVFGSFIAFSAYVWLLKHTTPARATTYAYVNPVVAVLLGWALADEPLNLRVAFAVVLLISAVIIITHYGRHKGSKPGPTTSAPDEPTPSSTAE